MAGSSCVLKMKTVARKLGLREVFIRLVFFLFILVPLFYIRTIEELDYELEISITHRNQ